MRFSSLGDKSCKSEREIKGFSVKFYTEEGNYDVIGSNFPV